MMVDPSEMSGGISRERQVSSDKDRIVASDTPGVGCAEKEAVESDQS